MTAERYSSTKISSATSESYVCLCSDVFCKTFEMELPMVSTRSNLEAL